MPEGQKKSRPKAEAYFKTLACDEAVDLCKSINSEGADNLLMPPSHGGWGTTMGYPRERKILQEHPSMLDKPWKEAAALKLSVVTRKEKEGQSIKIFKKKSQFYQCCSQNISTTPAEKEGFSQKNTTT